METENLTVMFTDIKGFTSRTSNQSRAEINKLLELHDKLIRPVLSRFKGKVIKTMGDAFLVTFKSPTNAVLCGIKIQEVLNKHNAKCPEDDQLNIRIAINTGEVNIRGNDVFGEAVNIAARIEGIAEAGEIYFTESVYLSMNKREIPSAEIGHRYLKGIPHEIKVYKVLKEGEPVKMRKGVPILLAARIPIRKRRWFRIMLWIVGILFVLGLIGSWTEDNSDITSNVIGWGTDMPPDLTFWIEQAEIAVQDYDEIEASFLLDEMSYYDIYYVPAYPLILTTYLLDITGRHDEMIDVLWYAVETDTDEEWVLEAIEERADRIIEIYGIESNMGYQADEIWLIADEKLYPYPYDDQIQELDYDSPNQKQ